MFSTSFKIVIGYILLVGLLIGAVTYTMQQMNLLTTPTSLRDQLDHRRHITHRIISQLYDAESIGQTLRTGNLNEYYHYLKAMKEVNASIDTLETILTDTLQQARLDTVRTLLQNKQWNMCCRTSNGTCMRCWKPCGIHRPTRFIRSSLTA